MGQANCIHARMLNDARYEEKFLAYTLNLNNNINKTLNNKLDHQHHIGRHGSSLPNSQKRHSPDGARTAPVIHEELPRRTMTTRSEDIYGRTPSRQQRQRRTAQHNQSTTSSRVIYTPDGRYQRYPQPSPPKPCTTSTYKTSTPVRSSSYSDEESLIRRDDPSGDSSNLYSSPSTMTSTINDDDDSHSRPVPTPPAYKSPPPAPSSSNYGSVVRRSPSGASFEFSPSPIHNNRRSKVIERDVNRNINDSDCRNPKNCDKLDILEVISNHSNPESNYEEIVSLNRAKEGSQKEGHYATTEPKILETSSQSYTNEAIYDRIIKDLSKGIIGNDSFTENSTSKLNRMSSLVLSARQRASLVCLGGLADDSLLKQTLQNNIDSLEITDEKNDSVNCWLQEMRLMTEPECLTALQSKLLSKIKDDVNLVNVSNLNTKDMVQLVYSKAIQILDELSSIVGMLDETDNWGSIRVRVELIISQIKKLVYEYHQASQSKLMFSLEKVLSEACLTLSQRMNDLSPRVSIMASLLDKVQCSFRKLVVEMVAQEIQSIVTIMEEPGNDHLLRQAVQNTSILGMQGTEMCSIIAESGGVRGLLAVIMEKRYRYLKAQAIRALATICCVPQAISELEKQGGVECLTDILCDVMSNEQEKSEAAGVIAQITSPWIEYNQKIQGLVENAEDLVRSLTELADKTKSSEVFLLSAAALANITFMENHACYYLKENGTVKTLIRAARFSNKANSLFAKDQVATVLANMSAVKDYRADLLDNGGIVLLLCYLQERPTVVYTKPELAACERVQQKSAIALARLCSEQDAAESISKLQGIPRLVRLCKDEKERNCSDSVLIACLAALRKISAKIGKDVLKDLEAEDLIDMKLLDNYKKYSTIHHGKDCQQF